MSKLKVIILGNANSNHTLKWVKGLSSKNIHIILFSFEEINNKEDYSSCKNFNFECSKIPQFILKKRSGSFPKIFIVKTLLKLKSVIKKFSPDLIHAHYASSYGLLGALSGFDNLIISSWGSDVFHFPKISLFHKKLLEFNLNKAKVVLATSNLLANETALYTKNQVLVTPFGVDTTLFQKNRDKNQKNITIGIVKSLEERYGLFYLLKAFHILQNKHDNLKLIIVGDGSKAKELSNLSKELNIEDKTSFVGEIRHSLVNLYHSKIDISVFPSQYESFGVSVVEASSCENPVVVSKIGGLPEIVEDGITGILVEPNNVENLVTAIDTLITNKELREKMGKAGRKRVKRYYSFENNLNKMIGIYNEVIKG